MDVIGHDHKGVPDIVPKLLRVELNGLHNHMRDGWLAKVHRTAASFVEEAIPRGKRLAGTVRFGLKGTIRRQAAVETPCNEYRLASRVEVG